MQHVRDEASRLQAAENRAAVFARERDAARAKCVVLRRQLDTMQEELDSARHMMKDHQDCAGLCPEQGGEGQPSGMMDDVPRDSDAEDPAAGKQACTSCPTYLPAHYGNVSVLQVEGCAATGVLCDMGDKDS